ncbi:MAG TPA: Crp/Fnr family transcriptional regulator [Lentimicrobium sp.]|nr:Crp/Fnr family transcriptional regulator [Lentimicrobium sp.]
MATKLQKALSFLNPQLTAEILENSVIKDIPQAVEILREGQYITMIPIVIDGLIKVYSTFGDKELLLYYVQNGESCIMSFSAGIRSEPSKVNVVAEKDTQVVLMPVAKVMYWINKYPEINALFYQQYNLRYIDLLDTINHVLFNKMDIRLLDYLQKKSRLSNQKILKITHGQIAVELGTAREVVSRVMKKLEADGYIKQHSNSIEVADL